jgi:hypothetical protein
MKFMKKRRLHCRTQKGLRGQNTVEEKRRQKALHKVA